MRHRRAWASFHKPLDTDHIATGRIQLEGSPGELIAHSRGSIWAKTIERSALEAVQARYEVISTRLFAGCTIVHVIAEHDPGNGFAPVEGGLEDVYLSTLTRARRATAAQAA